MIENILNQLKQNIENIKPVDSKYTISRGQNNGFELLINDTLQLMKTKSMKLKNFNFTFKLHYGSHFPDLDIYIGNKKYGIEIKSRQKLNWTTNGNSVMESISSTDYDDIYILFGAYDENISQYLIKYGLYWESVEGIKVTHSPRFYINMDNNSSVFSSKGEYNRLRKSDENNKIRFLQNYLKEKTKGSKWYIPPDNNEIHPINLSNIDKDIKERIIAEIYILFPNDIIKFKSNGQLGSSNYNNAIEYLISNYFYYSSSFRDLFSAGGKFLYHDIEYPRVIGNLNKYKAEINNILETSNRDFKLLAMQNWLEVHTVDSDLSFKENYYNILDQMSLECNYQLSSFLK